MLLWDNFVTKEILGIFALEKSRCLKEKKPEVWELACCLSFTLKRELGRSGRYRQTGWFPWWGEPLLMLAHNQTKFTVEHIAKFQM